jgi:hypothetical protein
MVSLYLLEQWLYIHLEPAVRVELTTGGLRSLVVLFTVSAAK